MCVFQSLNHVEIRIFFQLVNFHADYQHYLCDVFDHIVKSDNFASKGKVKGIIHPRTGHADTEGEQMYISTLPLTSAVSGVGG
jgi:predicted transcriptional regulator with HTH domain